MEACPRPVATGIPAAVRTVARRADTSLLREVALVVIVYLGYGHVRSITRDDAGQAISNARTVIALERELHLFTERTVQKIALHSDALIWFLDHYYARVHFPLTTAFVVWLLVRHRDAYRTVRTWLILVTLAALAIHVGFPLAPPRMLTEYGFVDTLRERGPRIYSSNTADSVANQFAAMPSLHFGWSVIVAAGFVMVRRTRWSALALAHPLITLLAIVATANHYWLDAQVALALVIAVAGALAIASVRGWTFGWLLPAAVPAFDRLPPVVEPLPLTHWTGVRGGTAPVAPIPMVTVPAVRSEAVTHVTGETRGSPLRI